MNPSKMRRGVRMQPNGHPPAAQPGAGIVPAAWQTGTAQGADGSRFVVVRFVLSETDAVSFCFAAAAAEALATALGAVAAEAKTGFRVAGAIPAELRPPGPIRGLG